MPPQRKRRAIKLRAVSTPGQAGPDEASLPAQDAILEKMAVDRNVEIIDDIVIPGFSRDFYSWHDFTEAAKLADIDAGERMLAHWTAKDFDEVLVYDGTRFARKESIFIEFYLRTRDIGAVIVRHLGDEMTMTDIGPAMFEAYASGQEQRTRKARLKMGREKRFDDGKPYADVPISHIELHDDQHKPLGIYELNPLMTSIWPDVKTLLLRETAWTDMERALYEEFGHVNPLTGRPFPRNTFYRLLTRVPMVHGMIAVGHSNNKVAEAEKGQEKGRVGETPFVHHWIYDARVPIPAHIKVRRNACPAVFTGEDYEAVVAELCARRDKAGRNSPLLTYPYSGLCICDLCSGSMKVKHRWVNRARTRKQGYMGCNYTYHHCQNQKSVRFDDLQEYVTSVLYDIIQAHDWPAPLAEGGQDTTIRAEQLRQEEARIDAQMNTLISELSEDIPQAARQKIRQRLTDMGHRLDVIRDDQRGLEQAARQTVRRRHVVEDAISELETITVPGLWALPAREINHFLKKLFDGRKIVIREKEIVGIR